ncbi:YeiH family protein [Knoellia sp. CPCC 206435]|uniref:YeiH family protein n=1 Tax=Knoellia terrae TaxID=3404797 RepID=UPI003B43A1AB
MTGDELDEKAPSIWPGLTLAFAAAGAALLAQQALPAVSPLLVAIVLGVALTNLWTVPQSLAPGLQVAAKRLLRLGIVMLGLQLALGDILALGPGMILVVLLIVGLGIAGTVLIGRTLGVPPMQRLLIACGFSICGAAAVAAVDGAIGAEEEDVASAIGLVVVFGTAMIGVVPAVLGVMDLTSREQGLIAGGSIHEVAQVVAAGGIMGGGALTAAVVVKLARVLMLAPVILMIGLARRRLVAPVAGKRPALLPLFVGGFLVAALARTLLPLGAPVLEGGRIAQTILLSAAMFSLGCGVRISMVKTLGGRPVVLATLSTAWVFAIATIGVLLIG